MLDKEYLIKLIDNLFFNVKLTNIERLEIIDKINILYNTTIKIGDIPCMRSPEISTAVIEKERPAISGSAWVILSSLGTMLTGHILNPDIPVEKLLILLGISTISVALDKPLTKLSEQYGGSSFLSVIGAFTTVIAVGKVRSIQNQSDRNIDYF